MSLIVEVAARFAGTGATRLIFESGQPVLVEGPTGVDVAGDAVEEGVLFEALTVLLDEDQQADLALGNPAELEIDVAGTRARLQAEPRREGIYVVVELGEGTPAGAPGTGPVAPSDDPDATVPISGGMRLEEEDAPLPDVATSGSWLPTEPEVETADVQLEDGLRIDAGPPEAFPSALETPLTSGPEDPHRPWEGAGGLADPAERPTRGEVPVVGHDTAWPGDGAVSATAEVPMEEPEGRAAVSDTVSVPEDGAEPAGSVSQGPTSAPIRRHARAVADAVASAPADDGRILEFVTLVERLAPGEASFLRLAPDASPPPVAVLAEAVATRGGAQVVVLDVDADTAAWERAEDMASTGAVVLVSGRDPSRRLGILLRMVEAGGRVIVITSARTPAGALRVLLGLSASQAARDWVDAIGIRWLELTRSGWQAVKP